MERDTTTPHVACCPYCHGVPYVQPHGAPGLESWQVICPDCQMAGPVVPREHLAVTYWNHATKGWTLAKVKFRKPQCQGHARPGVRDMKDED